MTQFYLRCFIALLAVPLLRMFAKPEKVYEFPYFMAVVFAVYILPQAFSLIRFPGDVSPESVDAVLLMSCLCMLCCIAGYQLRSGRLPVWLTELPVNPDRLFHAGVFFIATGFLFNFRLRNIEIECSERGGMTGIGTILLFFQELVFPGLAICWLDAVRRPRAMNVAASLVGLVIPVQSVIVGRRQAAVQLGLTILLGLYFGRGIRPPRMLIPAAAIVAMLAIPATGTYRALRAEGNWADIRQIDLVANFKDLLNHESVLELRNAAAVIEAVRRTGDYEFGAFYWDHLVFRFVPAQILGERFKKGLMIQPERGLVETGETQIGYKIPNGATLTGMGDSFQQFGWFGCLFFALMAMLFRGLLEATHNSGAIMARLFYMMACTSAMRSVTHQTADFLPGLVYHVIFLGIAFLYARQPLRGIMKPGGDGRVRSTARVSQAARVKCEMR
jgi:hypothetical protein